MPRPDLKLVDGGGGYVTLSRKLVYLGRRSCLVEVTEAPLKRRWLPAQCIVSQGAAVGQTVTMRVPLGLAVDNGLVRRGGGMMVGAQRLVAVTPARAEDRITLPGGNP
jgi:hypothetical protein